MNTYNQQKTDEQYYYDTLNKKNAQRSYFNWVPLLLIPLFFVLGWVTKGAYDAPANVVNNPQYGVGAGGPANGSPYATGPLVSPSPSEQPITVSIDPSATPDSEVEDTASPSPRATPTAEPSETPEE